METLKKGKFQSTYTPPTAEELAKKKEFMSDSLAEIMKKLSELYKLFNIIGDATKELSGSMEDIEVSLPEELTKDLSVIKKNTEDLTKQLTGLGKNVIDPNKFTEIGKKIDELDKKLSKQLSEFNNHSTIVNDPKKTVASTSTTKTDAKSTTMVPTASTTNGADLDRKLNEQTKHLEELFAKVPDSLEKPLKELFAEYGKTITAAVHTLPTSFHELIRKELKDQLAELKTELFTELHKKNGPDEVAELVAMEATTATPTVVEPDSEEEKKEEERKKEEEEKKQKEEKEEEERKKEEERKAEEEKKKKEEEAAKVAPAKKQLKTGTIRKK